MSPARTTLNLGRWLDEMEEQHARVRRVCSAHGFTPAVLEALVAGADLRDRGPTPAELIAAGHWRRVDGETP